MANIIRFVDSATATPTTRLDLNSTLSGLMVAPDGIDLSPPPVRRSVVTGFLNIDGDPVTATADANRLIKLPLQVLRSTADAAALTIQNLVTQLQVENILMMQLSGMSQPVFFFTYPAPDFQLNMWRLQLEQDTQALLEIPALSYGVGPKVTLPPVTIWNDPARTATLNANPFFETDVANWSNAQGITTINRTTSTFHEGVASMQIFPDGVTANPRVQSEELPAVAGITYRATGWLRSNSGTPSAAVRIQFLDASHSNLTFAGSPITLSPSTTWIFSQTIATAPPNTAFMRLIVPYSGTPTTLNVIQADELMIWAETGVGGPNVLPPNGMCFDVTGVLGDVETPLYLSVAPNLASSSSNGVRRSAIAVRRRGNPSRAEMVLQAENMDLFNGATYQAADPTASGPTSHGVTISGGVNNFVRISFGVTPGMAQRLLEIVPDQPANFPEARGQYNVLLRVRHATASDTFTARMEWGSFQANHIGPTVTIPADTGTGAPNWFYVNLTPNGPFQLPPGFDPETDGYSGTPLDAAPTQIWFSFARGTGTGTLDVDLALLLPADDHFATIDWHALDNNIGAYIIDGRRNSVYAMHNIYPTSLIDIGNRAVAGAFPMLSPGETNRIVFVRDIGSGPGSTQAVGTGDNINTTTTFTPYYWPRYRVIRPAAT